MAADQLEVWQIACGRIRAVVPTSTTPTSSPAAKACDREWATVRDVCLSAGPWWFARQRRTVSEYGDPSGLGHPEPIGGAWTGRYLLSGIAEVQAAEVAATGQAVEYRLFTDDDGTDPQLWLFADTTEDLVVTGWVDPGVPLWPARFVDLVAWRLAAAVAMPLTGQAETARWCEVQAERAQAELRAEHNRARNRWPRVRVRAGYSARLARLGSGLGPVEGV